MVSSTIGSINELLISDCGVVSGGDDVDKEKLTEKIKSQAKDGKISCRAALKLAEDEGVPSRTLGELLNELKIKVSTCQLGCFP